MLEWKEKNGEWYCYKAGAMVKGWVEDENGKWFYLNDSNGKMATGWIEIDSKWYYLYPQRTEKDSNTHYKGEMATGWIEIDSRWYYLYAERTEKDGNTHYKGEMSTGWIEIDFIWYYLYTEKTEKDGNTHYKGEMATGWLKLNEKWYYLYSNGKMATNTTIDGWSIDSSGLATLDSHTGSMTENAKYIYSFFRERGWTSNSICGLLGNMQGESGIIADKNEVGGGGGYGLVQWTPKSNLTNWANQKGLDYRTVDTQCKRIQWELENGGQFYATKAYPMNFRQFTQSTASPTYLAKVFINNYERPANPNQPKRGVWAEEWYSVLVK